MSDLGSVERAWADGYAAAQHEVERTRAEVAEWKDEVNYYQAKARKLQTALEQARTAILSDLVWLTPNVGGWQLDRAREATEKSLKQIEAALTNEREGK